MDQATPESGHPQMVNTPRISLRRLYLNQGVRYTGNALSILSLIFLIVQFFMNFKEIPQFQPTFQSFFNIIFAVGIGIFNLILLSQAWRQILKGQKLPISSKRLFFIYSESNLGKFLPGNSFQFLGRYRKAQELGLDKHAALLSMGIEVTLLCIAAFIAALPGVLVYWNRFFSFLESRGFVWVVTILVLGLVGSSFYILRTKLGSWYQGAKEFLVPRNLAKALVVHFTFFILLAFQMDLIVNHCWEFSHPVGWIGFVPGVATAWLIGFLAPGSPAGLGIRELILFAFFAPVLGSGFAALLLILIRLINVAADLGSWWLARRFKSAMD
jgi:hypothetical protein